jgi:MFS transporter, SP family, sugar:H+ symporter
MAVGAISTTNASQYGGKVTIFVVLSCITAGMGGVNFGYDIGVSGN